MRILIVSDTHKAHKGLETAIERTGKIDMLIHLGDTEGGEDYIEALVGCPSHIVRGNNDFFSQLPAEEEFLIGNYHVFITHGHYYYVGLDEERLKEEARSRGADIVMYGHTHRPSLSEEKGLITLNPGSIAYPRQMKRQGSYMLMELDEAGKAHFELKYV